MKQAVFSRDNYHPSNPVIFWRLPGKSAVVRLDQITYVSVAGKSLLILLRNQRDVNISFSKESQAVAAFDEFCEMVVM